MKSWIRYTAALLTLVLAFSWGYLSRRNKIFPHPQLKALLGERLRGAPRGEAPQIVVKTVSKTRDSLMALPYVEGTISAEPDARGVIIHDAEKAFPGYNLYHSTKRRGAFLIDMNGDVVHRWQYPEGVTIHTDAHLELLPERGDLLVRAKSSIEKIDRDSRRVWSYSAETHHDFWIHTNGEIYAMIRQSRLVPELHPEFETLDESIAILSPEGVERKRISLPDALLRSPWAGLLPAVSDLDRAQLFGLDLAADAAVLEAPALDILHSNHVEVFDGALAERGEIYGEGNLLVSIRNLNTILILDPSGHRVIWLWGPNNLTFQHHPSLLPNGHILLFNNGIESSEILELDPLSRRVVWRYADGELFSRTRGSAQRLPNGNTLITESDSGNVLEVTAQKEIVWKFANPDVLEDGLRRAIWRMQRFSPDDLTFLTDSRSEPR